MKKVYAKKWMACVLAALTVGTSATACSGTRGAKTSSGGETSSKSAPITLNVWGYGDSKTADVNAVGAAVSKITEAKINVKINLVCVSDTDKLNLAMTSGQGLDLICLHGQSSSLSTLANSGKILAIDDLLDKYGSGIKPLFTAGQLDTGRINGKLYTIPTEKDNARSAGMVMKKSIVDALKIDYKNIKTFSQVHDVLLQVKKAYPKLYPVVPSWSGGGMQDQFKEDGLGDWDGFGVLEDCTKSSTHVVDLYETDTFKNFAEMMYQWNKEGLIAPDATTTTSDNMLKPSGFSQFENIYPGENLEIKLDYGVDVVPVQLTPIVTFTSLVQGGWAIAAGSKYPEKAMELWNLMYTNADVSTLLVDGIEGKNYVYTDKAHNVIDFPSGVDGTNASYNVLTWAWPNAFITPIWKGTDLDHWKQLQEFNDDATESPALGFSFDNANVMNEITACENVSAKYSTALHWGQLDPSEALPKFIKELKNAGVATIVAEKQKQLNEWLKTKK